MSERASIGEWLRRAYEGAEACPPPEAYLPEEIAALDAAARERLESHARECAACAAERELANAFGAPDPATSEERRDIDRIVRRLERRPAHGGSGRLLGGPSFWSSLGRAPALRWAAALVVLIGVGIGVRNASTPPPLPEGPGESATRSSTLEVVAPLGELEAPPGDLVWRSVENASEYRATIRGVDDRVLWRGTTTGTTLVVDEALGKRLLPAVTYVWTVEAVNDRNERIAWSADTRFHIRPGAEDLP